MWRKNNNYNCLIFVVRIRLILDEVLGYNADILCLQEVDRKVFENDLEPVLRHHGLEGVFARKGGQTDEGEACFFRSARFRLVSTHRMHFAELLPTCPSLADIWVKIRDNKAVVEKVTARNTILQVLQKTPYFLTSSMKLFF